MGNSLSYFDNLLVQTLCHFVNIIPEIRNYLGIPA